MSKERRRARFDTYQAPQGPSIPDITDDIAKVVGDRENKWLKTVEGLHATCQAEGLSVQARIYQELHYSELDRLDPRDKWACENGQKRPEKPRVDWDNV